GARHHDVREDEIEALLLEHRERARGVVADDGLESREPERARQRGERRLIVVDEQDARHAGSSTWTIVPLPGALSTHTLPLWSATVDWTMASPSPVPCCLVV